MELASKLGIVGARLGMDHMYTYVNIYICMSTHIYIYVCIYMYVCGRSYGPYESVEHTRSIDGSTYRGTGIIKGAEAMPSLFPPTPKK